MIRYADLRDKLIAWPKYPGTRPVLRAPLITAGFPGTFNMSYTEHHWLQEYGSYTDWDHDYAVSTVQSCVRPEGNLIPTTAAIRYCRCTCTSPRRGDFEARSTSTSVLRVVPYSWTSRLRSICCGTHDSTGRRAQVIAFAGWSI